MESPGVESLLLDPLAAEGEGTEDIFTLNHGTMAGSDLDVVAVNQHQVRGEIRDSVGEHLALAGEEPGDIEAELAQAANQMGWEVGVTALIIGDVVALKAEAGGEDGLCIAQMGTDPAETPAQVYMFQLASDH
jgi:hypothetical protein